MHLDARGYAYESFRDGGRVCRRYVGSGEWIGAALWLDERDRQERAEKRAEARAQIERAASGTDELKALCAASDRAFRAAMKASGFHRIKRGPWRKARALQARNPMAKTKTTETLSPKVAALEPKERETSDLMKCAQNGDYNAAQELMKLMKGDPNECEFMALCVPFVRRAREALVGLKSNNELAKAALDRHMDLMRDELAGPNPSPLERMLAERVVLCFYQVEILSAFLMEMQRESLSRAEPLSRQLDGAHRRHLSAVRTLAEIRKLQLPNVQVNIGEKQVNIGQLNAPTNETAQADFAEMPLTPRKSLPC